MAHHFIIASNQPPPSRPDIQTAATLHNVACSPTHSPLDSSSIHSHTHEDCTSPHRFQQSTHLTSQLSPASHIAPRTTGLKHPLTHSCETPTRRTKNLTSVSTYIPPQHVTYSPTVDVTLFDLDLPSTVDATILPNAASAIIDAYRTGRNVLPPGDTTVIDIINTLERATDQAIRRARTRVPRYTPYTSRPCTDEPAKRHSINRPHNTRRAIDAYIRRNRRFDSDIT